MSLKTRLLTAAGIAVIATGGVALANSQPEPIAADEVPPIVQQVEDHEVRITDLEGRADDTDEKVATNTTAIGQLQQNTLTASSDDEPESPTPPSTPGPEPEPEPQPTPHPRTITAVRDEP